MGLEDQLIRLGTHKKHLRPHIRKVLAHVRRDKKARKPNIDKRDYRKMRDAIMKAGDGLMAFHGGMGDVGHLLDEDRELKRSYKKLMRAYYDFQNLLEEHFVEQGKTL